MNTSNKGKIKHEHHKKKNLIGENTEEELEIGDIDEEDSFKNSIGTLDSWGCGLFALLYLLFFYLFFGNASSLESYDYILLTIWAIPFMILLFKVLLNEIIGRKPDIIKNKELIIKLQPKVYVIGAAGLFLGILYVIIIEWFF